ncbi:MAG TPA: glycoside hydrolase family 2 [Acholeplasmataceae bacterium]|jgi:beta-galactosidase/beta-glucuronidase|nr:glycoside hydrolase family 2 [Acholeplasmataceae bacterium]
MRRSEYPRPNFVRDNWQNLNGTWDFAFDDNNVGHKEKWYKNPCFDLKIEVPFAFQSKLSKINVQEFHDRVWYRRKFKVNKKSADNRIILHIGACDYESEVYINGELVKTHIGGHSSFKVDITDYLNYEEEEIVIFAYDNSTDEFIPRGKQYWKEKNESIYYTRTTGLWQTVWLEEVNEIHVNKVKMTSDIDTGLLYVDLNLSKEADVKLGVKVFDKDELIANNLYSLNGINTKFVLDIFQNKIMNTVTHHRGKTWSPENPYLFDIEFTLYQNEEVIDKVKSYFGMRKIHVQEGVVYLNNRPYYQKLILDQGYYEDGLLTAPTDQDLINDILLAKEMGFNGCRKHQVVSDPRFLYHADRLGFLVWGEMANCANFSTDYIGNFINEWEEVIQRDYNHPSIVCWVPLNESWGTPNIDINSLEQHLSLTLYNLTKSIDKTRLVVSNDGWEHTVSDLCTIHNYNHGGPNESTKHQVYAEALQNKENILSYMPAGRNIYAGSFKYRGEPILLTEFGGITFDNSINGWGYSSVKDEATFLKEYERLINAIKASDCIVGFCYTQLTDVFQEKNGLLTFDRKFKADPKEIKKINDHLPLMAKKQKSKNRFEV